MQHAHESPSDKAYLAVFAGLAVLTGISFLVSENVPSKIVTILIVLGMATVKALLVAVFFMHLKFDWTHVKIMIVPAMILSAVLLFALLPDITFALRELPVRSPVGPAHAAHGHAP